MGSLARERRRVHPAQSLAFSQLETELGGRTRLAMTLLGADLPKHLQQFVGILVDPAYDDYQLAEIAELAAVTLNELQKVFVDARKMHGIVVATDRIVTAAPDVAAAVMADAQAGWRLCVECLGARVVVKVERDASGREGEVQVDCPLCRGRGEVYHVPDHDTQKTALKLAGLLVEKGPGVSVTTIAASLSRQAGDYDAVVSALDDVLYGDVRARFGAHALAGDALAGGSPDDVLADGDPDGSPGGVDR
ncbi:MAG TPA: hypothetical protein VFO16_14045 [Pseudonocardiaceae bacterium]|nr:hypothetical protein [Pseudonocardiaceae bacterium]